MTSVLLSLWLAAEPVVLGLREAVAEARAHGFAVRAARAQVAQAQGDVLTASALPNPVLQLGAGPSLGCYGARCLSGTPALAAQLSDSGALAQLLTGKRALRTEAARLGLRSTEAQAADAQRQLDSQVKQQFLAALSAQRAIRLAEEVRDSTARTAALIGERKRLGVVDEADVARVETQRLEAEQALDASRQGAAQQLSALAVLLGRGEGMGDLALDGRGYEAASLFAALQGQTPAALVERALAARPDVQAQERALAQAQGVTASLRRQRIPDVSLFASFGVQGVGPDPSNPPNLVLGLALPVPVAYQLQGELARAEASEEQAQVALEQTRAQVRSDVETAWAGYQGALAQARRMEVGLQRAASRARELVGVQYEKGAASLLELLDAQRTFVAINVEALAVTQAYWTSVFRLEAALGQELTEP